MTTKNHSSLASDTFEFNEDDVFLERIPDEIYRQMIDTFSSDYHFQNGERMNISNYFVGINRGLSDIFVQFINQMIKGMSENQFPDIPPPEGFKPHPQNLLQVELDRGFSLGSFDMAVTNEGLQNIEFQALATYPISAAKLNRHILDNLDLDNAFIFADSPETNWEDFINLYQTIIAGNKTEGIVLTDRKIKNQKTNFEFFATQKELNIAIDIVDMEDIFEKENELFYSASAQKSPPTKITRLYNRILLAEALFEDDYPWNAKMWKFRFDKSYQDLKFINHPIKQFDISKRLSPYISHPFNPDCFELSEVDEDFRNGSLKYEDYVWKHKWGAAGHRLVLEPSAEILDNLSEFHKDYIAQKKVNFKIFKTDDGQEKIIELRFMTAIHNDKMIIVPMARIGHITPTSNGKQNFKIHFADNNKPGYGFSPVIIFDK